MCDGTRMLVQKTAPRIGLTLAHGHFKAREWVYVCAAGCHWPSGALVTLRSLSLSEALPSDANVGYDVMVFVGLERFLKHRQREEIRTALKQKYGVVLSEGGVSNLATRFIEYLARLHRKRAPRLKEALEQDGGWPLHVDATGEAGRGTVLAVIAGWRKWVLGSWKISTERTDLILPCLHQVVERFGPPCAIMRDMGKAMTPAADALVSELEAPIPVLTCHQHFLADVGKDLLEPAHAELRSLFRRHKVRPKLRELVRDLGRDLGAGIADARDAVFEQLSQADSARQVPAGEDGVAFIRGIAQWVLDYKTDAKGLGFPFDRPYLDFHDRALKAGRAIDTFLAEPPADKKAARLLRRMKRHLDPVAAEVPFRQVTKRLRQRAELFDELRGVLRAASNLQENESPEDLIEMRDGLDTFEKSLRQRRPARGPAQDNREAIDIILDHIETHGPNLFGHDIQLPENAGGGVRLVARTNNLSENTFGTFKHGERERTGFKNLGHVLETMPAEALLATNLQDDDYVSILCDTIDKLPRAFAELDRKEREAQLRNEAPPTAENNPAPILSNSSLSKEDRRIVRTEKMNRFINDAANPKARRSPPSALNPTGS